MYDKILLFLSNFIQFFDTGKMKGSKYWIGLNDRAIDDEFVYIDVEDPTAPYFK